MRIQEETPLPASLLDTFESDYGQAVVHLAWDRHSETNERTLLFAFVELLPIEIPPPIDDYDPKSPRCYKRLDKHYVYVRHAVMTAKQALDWYLACRAGTATTPEGVPLRLADLGEEPAWPGLIATSDEATTIPFCPPWMQHPRTHHLLPLADFDFQALWTADEQTEARKWLQGRLHFDLGKYPEYWGSIHLLAPNPVYRKLHTRLQPRGTTSESVLLKFQPRAGQSVEGLEVRFAEKDPWGVTASRRIPVESRLLRMNFEREVTAVSVEVMDPKRGFLKTTKQSHTFVKTFQIDVSLAHKAIIRTSGKSFEVMRSSAPERRIGGTNTSIPKARLRLSSGHYARKQQATAKTQDQRWFRDQKEEAQAYLQSLLNEADEQVLVVDPYFGAEELVQFALAVGRSDIPIRLLTSSEILKEPVSKQSDIEKGAQLWDVFGQVQRLEHINPFEIRVMPGKKPAIHDRFLVVDKRIWLIGSSLNEFGSRGTMMLALPDPDAVRGDIEKAWHESETLEKWVERRRKNPDWFGDGI
jgi:hypothetical protein